MRPPITYYGGKQKLVKELLLLVPGHRLYIEPFMGGGALFFSKEPSKAEIINDMNGNVTNFYRVAQTQFDELKRFIDGTLHSRATYQEAMRVYNNPAENDNVKRAWAFWVATNDGFGAKIGTWAIEKKENKVGKTLANKRKQFTQEYAERLEYVQIENKDALEIISQYDSPNTFFYLDPPYFNSDCGHYKGYTETDYRKLLDALTTIKGKFLLSSYPSEILSRYVKANGWQYKEIRQRVAVTHKSRKHKTEVLVYNYVIENNKQPLTPVQKISDTCKQNGGKNVPIGVKNNRATSLPHQKLVPNFVSIKDDPTEKKLSLEYCRKVLEKGGKQYTDEEILRIRALLYRVGNLEYQLFTDLKQRQHGKHNFVRKGKHRRTGSQRDKHTLSKGKAGAIL